MSTHYQLRSAVEVNGTVRTAGSRITAEEFATLSDEGQELLLRDEHVVPCEPRAHDAVAPSPFPRKPTKAQSGKSLAAGTAE